MQQSLTNISVQNRLQPPLRVSSIMLELRLRHSYSVFYIVLIIVKINKNNFKAKKLYETQRFRYLFWLCILPFDHRKHAYYMEQKTFGTKHIFIKFNMFS